MKTTLFSSCSACWVALHMLCVFVSAALYIPLASAAIGVEVDYVDPQDGTSLRGFLAIPQGLTESELRNAVILFPDWDGVDAYERGRAMMVADELGYVAFAADVYGVDNYNPATFPERIELATLYRSNVTLFNGRMQAAVNLLNDGTFTPHFDASHNIGFVGYCFGGTGVLNYALHVSAFENNVLGVVSFHGGLSGTFIPENATVSAMPQVLILSGGDDDASSTVAEIEAAFNEAGRTWEITRFSDVIHGFTVFNTSAYDERADTRGWDSMKLFFSEVLDANAPVAPQISLDTGAIPMTYFDIDGSELNGFYSIPGDLDAGTDTQVPVVIIIHDLDGIGDYELTRASMINDLGYVGFVADIYSKALFTATDFTNRTQTTELLAYYRDNVQLFTQRIKAAITAAKTLPNVDPENIAIIGYCFGGTGAITYALEGESEAVAVVSFHGGLSTLVPKGLPIQTKMLIQSGGSDDASSSVVDLEAALNEGGAEWEMTRYSGVVHAFTVFNDVRGRYNVRADTHSWTAMGTFLTSAFGRVEVTLNNSTDIPIIAGNNSSNGFLVNPISLSLFAGLFILSISLLVI
eukprot:scaffold108107_cov58-Attheya_sp.AAC.1